MFTLNNSHISSFFVRLSIRVLSLVLFFTVAQTQVYAVYNQGTYGSGTYSGSATTTPAPTATGSSSNSSNGSTLGAADAKSPSCSERPPGSAPDLFQIDRSGRAARLFFAPAMQPYNKYIVAYGVDDRTEQFGVQFDMNNSTGVIDFTVNELDPSTDYSFKVRAGNGCATGEWSDVLKVGAVGNVKQSFYRGGGSSGKADISVAPMTSAQKSTRIGITPTGAKVRPETSAPESQDAPIVQPLPKQNNRGVWSWFLNLFK